MPNVTLNGDETAFLRSSVIIGSDGAYEDYSEDMIDGIITRLVAPLDLTSFNETEFQCLSECYQVGISGVDEGDEDYSISCAVDDKMNAARDLHAPAPSI